MDLLASDDDNRRQKARESLVGLGKPAVPSLIHALQNSTDDHVRWEAAKALGELNDPRSISPLVKALEDSNTDVAWLAAEALHNFRKEAWPALLRELIELGSASAGFCQGVHHVLLNQKEDGFNKLLAILVKSLESGAAPGSAPVAANEILKRMDII